MWLAGKQAIADYCKLSIDLLTTLYKKRNLPVYIHKKGAKWRTTTEALDEWLNIHVDKKNHNLIKPLSKSCNTPSKTVSKTLQK